MSLAEFISMGGYAPFVWSSFGIVLIVLVGNIVAAKSQRRRITAEIKRLDTGQAENQV